MDPSINQSVPLRSRLWNGYYPQGGTAGSVACGAKARRQTFPDVNANMMRLHDRIQGTTEENKTKKAGKANGANAFVHSCGIDLNPSGQKNAETLMELLEDDCRKIHGQNVLLRKHSALLNSRMASQDIEVSYLRHKVKVLEWELTVRRAGNLVSESSPETSAFPSFTQELPAPNTDFGYLHSISAPSDVNIEQTGRSTHSTFLQEGRAQESPSNEVIKTKQFAAREKMNARKKSVAQPKKTSIADDFLKPLSLRQQKGAARNEGIPRPSEAVESVGLELKPAHSVAGSTDENGTARSFRSLPSQTHPLDGFWTSNNSPTISTSESDKIPDWTVPSALHSNDGNTPKPPQTDDAFRAPSPKMTCEVFTLRAKYLPQLNGEQRFSTDALHQTDTAVELLQSRPVLLDTQGGIKRTKGSQQAYGGGVSGKLSLRPDDNAKAVVRRHGQSQSVQTKEKNVLPSKGDCLALPSTIRQEKRVPRGEQCMLASLHKEGLAPGTTTPTQPQAVYFLRFDDEECNTGDRGSFLRFADEECNSGDRDSHVTVCALCHECPLDDTRIIFCQECPRIFCVKCLVNSLPKQDMGLSADTRAFLEGDMNFLIRKCPSCVAGRDAEFCPPEGIAPMKHLLKELLSHELSRCFREPVDTWEHPDYFESVGRGCMIDLGTMMKKLDTRKYPRRRGPGQYLDDLSRIWRNTRKYAGCDELGRPYHGTTVPSIVRCALILEAMSERFCAAYMSDQHEAVNSETSWDHWRQKKKQETAEARLRQFERRGTDKENKVTGRISRTESSGCSAPSTTRANYCEERPVCSVGKSELSSSVLEHFARKRSRPVVELEAKETEMGCKRGNGQPIVLGDTNCGGESVPRNFTRHSASMWQQPQWTLLDDLCERATEFERSRPSVAHKKPRNRRHLKSVVGVV